MLALLCVVGLDPHHPPRDPAAGASHDSQRIPNAHIFRAPALQNNNKIPREDTQRDTERAKMGREREKKKARNFGPTTVLGTALRGPMFPGFGPHLLGPTTPHNTTQPHATTQHNTQQQPQQQQQEQQQQGLAKIGLAQIGFGPNWPGQNQDGQNWIGQN